MKNCSGNLRSISTLAFILCALALDHVQASGSIFAVEGNVNKNDGVIITKVDLELGDQTAASPKDKDYSARLISEFGRELHVEGLAVGFEIIVDPLPGVSAQNIELNESPFVIRLPFYYSADRLEFRHGDKIIKTINLPQAICQSPQSDGLCQEFCQGRGLDPDCFQCGNGFCDPNETFNSCSLDCDAPVAAQVSETKFQNYRLAVGVVAGMLIAGVLATLFVKRARRAA